MFVKTRGQKTPNLIENDRTGQEQTADEGEF